MKDRLREIIQEIAEGRGPFNRDQLVFANNVIEKHKTLAAEALAILDEEALGHES